MINFILTAHIFRSGNSEFILDRFFQRIIKYDLLNHRILISVVSSILLCKSCFSTAAKAGYKYSLFFSQHFMYSYQLLISFDKVFITRPDIHICNKKFLSGYFVGFSQIFRKSFRGLIPVINQKRQCSIKYLC